MNIARVLWPVKVLGPGDRIGIWTAGCGRRCPSCSNPELWIRRPEYEISPEQLFALIRNITGKYHPDGFTVSGGEPMDQAEELSTLIGYLKTISPDILIYSGYTIEQLKERKDAASDFILNEAAVLIDGDYREELNENLLLRGSSNQRIHILNSALKEKYEDYLSTAVSRIQNFTVSDGVISVGIHHRGFSGGQ